MSDKKTFESAVKKFKKNEEKILYGVNKTVCFACGEEIDKNIAVCPYCKTNFK